jgi:type IV secretion system protein VirB10
MSDATRTTDAETRSEVSAAAGTTDLHRSKISPDDPRLRLERPRLRTLRRGPVIAAVLAMGAIVAGALLAALAGTSSEQASKKEDPEPEATPTAVPLPDVIKEAPVDHEDRAAPPRAGGKPQAAAVAEQQAAAAEDAARREEILRARSAGLFSFDDAQAIASQDRVVEPAQRNPTNGAEPAGSGPPAAEAGQPADPNLQGHKNDFLARTGVSAAEYLEKPISHPRSPYEVKAGTVIPTVLISGINSDLPGQIIAQVRENVYDTVTGNYLLIPQGSRVLATYDSMIAWGQGRVLVCWNRLIRPDGSSLTLECMPGVDLAGYGGFADEVDNHWAKIIAGAVLSSVLAATAQRSQGNVAGFQPTIPQVWASNAAGQINQAGQQLTQKNLQIQPTITVRPGFSVNVLVTKDIVIDPYLPGGTP